MTTLQSIMLDDAVALLGVVAWFMTAAAVAQRRIRLGCWLMGAALVLVICRVVTVALLAWHGWWFVQEKVLIGLPLLYSTGLAAVLIAGPAMLRARRGATALPTGCVVVVLTAGYAALAGLAVTFLVGYPVTWSAALITVAAVGGCALLTAGVVTRSPRDSGSVAGDPAGSGGPPDISRRRFITVAGGAAVVTAGGAGLGLTLVQSPTVDNGNGAGPSPRRGVSVSELRGATTPAPGGVVRREVLTAQKADVAVASGERLDAWTYNGRVPGPAIVASQGDLLEVTLRNADIEGGVTVHWHGYDVACGEDGAPGVTQAAVRPGEEFVYRFRAEQVGTYWYHTHQASHEGVRRGLYGTLVVHPRGERAGLGDSSGALDLTLPLHTMDGRVFIGDLVRFTDRVASVGTPVRLRLVNTDSDPHRVAVVGSRFRVAAVDGRDLHQPGEVGGLALRLAAGGRCDVVFDMPDRTVTLLVDNDRSGGLRLRPGDTSAAAGPEGTDTGRWPELDLLQYGQPVGRVLDPEKADRHFTIVLDRGLAMVDGRPAFAQTVNGLGHPSIPDQLVTEGDVVKFTVVNRSLETHPWHLHGHAVLVLSRNGVPPSGSPLWMDTFDVRPGEVWEVAFRATNPGIWMNHCHNLPHADQGMMLRLVYDGITPYDESDGHHRH
jgi:FtsP/CotA-like multicopper oxidase with cupredoxin domain